MTEAVEQNQEGMKADQSRHISPCGFCKVLSLMERPELATSSPLRLSYTFLQDAESSPFREVGILHLHGRRWRGGQSGLLGLTQQFLLFFQLIFWGVAVAQ